MAGPNAQIVGRVAVRVLPDTSGFRARLQAELAAMKDLTVRVQVIPDLDGFVARIRAAAAAASAAARVDVDVDVDDQSIGRLRDLFRRKFTLKGGLGDGFDFGDISEFERGLIAINVLRNRLHAGITDTADKLRDWNRTGSSLTETFDSMGRRVFVFGEDMTRARRAWNDIRYAARDTKDRIADTVRQVREFTDASGRAGRGIQRLWVATDRLRYSFDKAAGRARQLWDDLSYSGSIAPRLDADGKRVLQYVGRVNPLKRLWREIGYEAKTAGNRFTDALRRAREFRVNADTARNAMASLRENTERFREAWRDASYSDDIAPRFDANGKRIIQFAGRVSPLKQLWNQVAYSAKRAGASMTDSVRSLRNVGDAMNRIRNVDLSGSLNRIREGTRDLPGRIRDIGIDRLYNGFVQAGNGALALGRQSGRAFSSMGRGIKSTVAGLGSMARSTASAARSGASVSRAFRGFGRAGKSISGLLKPLGLLGKGLGLIPKAILSPITAFNSLGRTGKLVVAVLALLPGIIALVAGLIAGLPSLLLAAGVGVAAIALGLDGIKAAAKTLQPEFEKMKKSVSDTFEKGLKPVFASLKPIFPMLTAGMNSVSTGLISWAAGIAKVATSAAGFRQIQAILFNTGTFFKQMTPFITTSVQGFLTWGAAGSAQFGLLARVMNDFGTDWAKMTQRTVQNGTFKAAIEGLAKTFDVLFDGWIKLLEYGVGAMGRLGDPIAGLFKGLLDIIFSLMPALEAVFVLVSKLIQGIAIGFGPAVAALGPPLMQIANLIGDHFIVVMQALSPILMIAADTIAQLVQMLMTALAPIMPILVSLFQQLATTVGQVLTDALAIVMPFIQQIVTFASQLLMELAPLIPALMELATVVFQALIDILTALAPILMQLLQTALPMLVELIKIIAPELANIIRLVAEIIPVIVEWGLALLGYLMPIMNSLLELIKTVWPFIRDIIGGAMQAIKGIIEIVLGIISGDWDRVWNGIKDLLGGVIRIVLSILMGLLTGALQIISDLLKAIAGDFADVGKLLFNAGKAILQGLLDGIKSMWNNVKDFVTGIADWIQRNKGPISYDRKLLVPAGKAIMFGLNRGLQTGFKNVQSTVGGMAGRLTEAFNNSGIGADWAAGIEAGTPRAISAIQSVIDSMGSSQLSAEWQGAIDSDDYGNIGDKIAEVLAGWGVQIDSNGLAKLVNKSNTRKARRG